MPQSDDTPTRAARDAAGMLQHLAPGPLSELRRMDRKTGAPAFWRLVASHPRTIGHRNKQEQWMAIVRVLAILTPKGDPAERRPLHDPKRRLGTVLCDGGDPGWPPRDGGRPRPVFSEHRLAGLMAARGAQRGVLLERAARALTRSRTEIGIDVVDIAYTLLAPDDGRRLAEPYYRRYDGAERAAEKSEEGTT